LPLGPIDSSLTPLGILIKGSSAEAYLFITKKAIIRKMGLAEATGISGLFGGAVYFVYLVCLVYLVRLVNLDCTVGLFGSMPKETRETKQTKQPNSLVYLVCLVGFVDFSDCRCLLK
jgi:hypothetical protein